MSDFNREITTLHEIATKALKLPTEERRVLVKLLIAPPLQMVLEGDNQINDSILSQISMGDAKFLADLLDALSDRFRSDY